MPTPAPVQRVATARLPKLDLQAAPRTQVAAVPAPPPSAVPQSQAVAPAPVPRAIVEPRRGSQPPAPYPPLAGSVPARGASSIVQSDDAPAPASMAAAMPAQAVPSVVPVQPVAPQTPMAPQPESQQASISGLGGADGVLAQAFSQALAQSASTVTTAPAGTSFGAPSAAPLTAAQTSVPDIVRDTYNQTLIAGSGVATSATSATSATAASGTSMVAAPAGPTTVFFNNGSSGLNGKAKALIRNVAEAYKARRGSLRIVGHASSRTKNLPVQRHKIVNFRISLDRATAVANELIKLGVDKSAIQIAAVSDSQPVFFESMPEGEAGNRRAEIFYAF